MIGTKEISGEKESDRVTRKSVATAGGHRRKSQSMWCWMEVIKEGFLAQDGPEARHKDGEAVGRGTGWGWLKDSWCWSCCHHPYHSLCLLLLSPTGKRPKKGLATAKQRLGRILKIHRNGKLLL